MQLAELGLALLLSAIIGFERELRQKSAGLRTHTLIGFGSALFMLVSKYGFTDVLGEHVVLDPSRVAAQIVSGVGFLGAGLIFVRRDGVRGLTTAAGIWVTAAVGAAAGAGLLLLAVLTTGAYMVVTLILPAVQRFLLPVTVHRASTLYVRYPDGHGLLQAVADEATKRGYRIDSLSADPAADQMVAAGPRDDGRQAMAAVTLRVRGSRPVRELTAALNDLERVDAVITGDYPAMDE